MKSASFNSKKQLNPQRQVCELSFLKKGNIFAFLTPFLFTALFLGLSSFNGHKNPEKPLGFKKSAGLGKTFFDGGDFSIDFAASRPSTYDHATGGGVFGDNVESLQGGDFECGQIVSYLTQIKVNAGATGSQTIALN